MIKEVLVFAGAFAICAAVGATGAGCSDEGSCARGKTPVSVHDNLRITYGVLGTDGGPALDLRGGTLDVTPDTVIVRYTADAVAHEVVYKVSLSQ